MKNVKLRILSKIEKSQRMATNSARFMSLRVWLNAHDSLIGLSHSFLPEKNKI